MDKVEAGKDSRFTVRALMSRALKASVKTAVVYILFMVFSAFMAPFEGIYTHETLFTALFALYLIFIFIIELASDTVFQHIFSIAKSLMLVLYFAYVLNTGIIHFNVEQINLMVDLRFFFALFVLGGVLGFAKSMLRLLNWMNEKEEQWLKYQIKSL